MRTTSTSMNTASTATTPRMRPTRAINIHHRAQKVLKLGRAERLVRAEHKAFDIIIMCVMVAVCVLVFCGV